MFSYSSALTKFVIDGGGAVEPEVTQSVRLGGENLHKREQQDNERL